MKEWKAKLKSKYLFMYMSLPSYTWDWIYTNLIKKSL